MSIARGSVTTKVQLAAWLTENTTGLFGSVTGTGTTFTATDTEGNTILETLDGTSGYLRAYRAEGNYIQLATRSFFNNTMQVIACDNGVILDGEISDGSGYSRSFAMLFAKTNNDKIAIVFPSALSATAGQQYKNALNHVALGDSTTMSTTTTFTPEAGQQTSLVPFSTNADVEDVSYTPNAYWIAMSANYSMGMGKFRMGGDTFISNGYWAIKDNQSV